MKADLSKIPRSFVEDVEEFLRDNPSPAEGRKPHELDLATFLDFYLSWNGVMGYTRNILCIVNNWRQMKE